VLDCGEDCRPHRVALFLVAIYKTSLWVCFSILRYGVRVRVRSRVSVRSRVTVRVIVRTEGIVRSRLRVKFTTRRLNLDLD
jgi:hypothetical protein